MMWESEFREVEIETEHVLDVKKRVSLRTEDTVH